MKTTLPVLVFGEALFDCFPDGEQMLGGAPFNVAWHLQAFGDHPVFISRIGNDGLGRKILNAMHDWGMVTHSMQIDPVNQTGLVEVNFSENEPEYNIVADCAYDFISTEVMDNLPNEGLLYHGTLGLRNNISQHCLAKITQQKGFSVFLDVNLRKPWWQKQEVFDWLKQARWVKMNENELQQLGFGSADICESMHKLRTEFQLEHVILTRGAKGAMVLAEDDSLYREKPALVKHIVDTVGAGDAVSALFIHGLRAGWPIAKTLTIAQHFAGKVIGLRGATTTKENFYQEFLSSVEL